ncbi:formylglycine-generating enzyme family protein [Magnetospirillum fulvum]|uniref:Sulfatase-modifying factor enzyme-like domain-containing protein n=1 Tax=Magnetospirillum fulvum MGU-K5 TaxID=1316936 RepID=S9SA53_MAGFU|nr:formylglycine-generating enzyme family protein [Magnetospirillum fulvum]EPY00953.1 hypothetical protein K678_13483 [Magnetospirillum fulvum MGU-K5]
MPRRLTTAAALPLALLFIAALAAPQSADSAPVFRDCRDCPEMVEIPAGRFQMGSPTTDPAREPGEEPRHPVTIAKPFALAIYPVTQADWTAVMGTNPSHFRGQSFPVESISWAEAQTYIRRLNEKTGQSYRLPTEAEWEYAARAGTDTRYSWGDDIGQGKANCDGCGSSWGGRSTAPVGSFPPNPFGLYDMSGNVWQWTEDCWSPTYRGAPSDGRARVDRAACPRVLRGGSWGNSPVHLRSAKRMWFAQDFRFINLGFRLARDTTHP